MVVTMALRPSPAVVVAFGLAVAVVPLLTAPEPDAPRAAATIVEPAEVGGDPLVGLWSAHAPGVEGDPVQFYYFHGDGHGLYRYGRVGATNTNSFDYTVDGDVVTIAFRKTGARHRVHFAIEAGHGPPVLILDGDPKAGGRRRYAQLRPDPVAPHDGASCGGAPLGGRMWMDHVRFATGGYGFGLYQLRCAGIDGRGTGWFHRGDFDDWTTEALVYRIVGGRIELQFATGSGTEVTGFAVEPGDPATLTIAGDPRDFWHPHRYVDAGPAFGALGAPGPGALEVLDVIHVSP